MKTLSLAFSAALALLASATATAQAFPERPVQIITPYAAGGGLDIVTRALAQKLSEKWGKQVVVENRPGAGSTVGTAAAAKAPKDGYTLLVASTPLGVAPAVYSNLPYDARKDFAPLSLVATSPEVLVVNAGLGVSSLAELVKKAKAEPGKLNYGSAGSGTLAHLAADTINRRLALGSTHVPYKGVTPAVTDLIGGQIQWQVDTPSAFLQHVRAGKLRALALAAPARSPQMPDVPTFAEAGYPGVEFRIFHGLLAPAGTPEPALKALEAGIVEAMRDPALRANLAAQGWEPVGSSAKEFGAFLDQDLPKLQAAAKAAGVKAD